MIENGGFFTKEPIYFKCQMPSRKRKQETALEEDEVRKELRELKMRMAQMDEMSRKLDQLLQRR